MELEFLTGDVNWEEYGGKFVSEKFNNGSFDYWIVVDFTNLEDAMGYEAEDKYLISVDVVSFNLKTKEGKKAMSEASGSYGYSEEDTKNITDLMRVEALHGYGTSARMWSDQGSDIKELFKEAKEECEKVNMLFGFYMDRQQNALGATGWDFIKGKIIPK